MKKILLTLLLFSIPLTGFTYADQTKAGIFQLGYQAGVGINGGSAKTVSGSDLGYYTTGDENAFKDSKVEAGVAYNTGVNANYFVFNNLSIMTGLLYESKSLDVKYPKNTSNYDFEAAFVFNFITIPIGLRYYFTDWFFLGAGFYYAMPAGKAEREYKSSDKEKKSVSAESDYGFLVDLGFSFKITDKINLEFVTRYERGLALVYKKDDIVTDVKLTSLFFNAGVTYRLK
jgi:hypothetical protein